MVARFGPFSRWGSLVNAVFSGAIVTVALVRLYSVGESLPTYFPGIAVLFSVFLSVTVAVWWRYYRVMASETAQQEDRLR